MSVIPLKSKQLLPLGKNNDTSKTPPCIQKNHLSIFSSGGKISEKELITRNQKMDYALSRIGITPDASIEEGSPASQLTPYSIFHELVEGYEKTENTAAILEPFYQTTANFSRAMEIFRDFWAAVGKFLAYIFVPLLIFSAVYNACCQARATALDRTIRQPLFEMVQRLIEPKLTDENVENLDNITKLKYIALLSSINRQKTRELLCQPPYTNLIPSVENEQTSAKDTPNEPIFSQYEIFIQNLYDDLDTLSGQKDQPEQGDQGSNLKLKLLGNEDLEQENPNEVENLLSTIYTNLTTEEQLDEIGNPQGAMSIDYSPYKVFGFELMLQTIILNLTDAFLPRSEDKNTENECKVYPNKNFLKNPPPGCEYKKVSNLMWEEGEHYVSNDGTLHVATKPIPEKISLTDAKKLGLITPERAQKFEEQGIIQISPLFVTFRPARSVRDVLSAVKNIVDGQPKALEHASEFTRALTEEIEIINKEDQNDLDYTPTVPIFLGFSMGAMCAQAIAIEYGYSSIVINPLGTGKGVRDFIDRNRLQKAMSRDHALCNQTYFMEGDGVFDANHSLAAKFFVHKPVIGQSYSVDPMDENKVPGIPEKIKTRNIFRRHSSHLSTFKAWATTLHSARRHRQIS